MVVKMTRLTETLNNLKTCRRMNPNRRNYPVYRQLLPAKLNDTVKGRVEKTADGCVGELQKVLACWNVHDFESKPCEKEIKSFQACFTAMEKSVSQKRLLDAKGLIADEDTNLSRRQVNALLARFPQLAAKDKFKMDDSFKRS